MVLLARIADGYPASDVTRNERILQCPSCGQIYRLVYGETEGYHLGAWLRKADAVLRKSHNRDRHGTGIFELH
jgi:hypothetical protein